MIERHLTKRRTRGIVGIFLAIGLLVQCHRAVSERTGANTVVAADITAVKSASNKALAALTPTKLTVPRPSLEELAAADPIAFFEMAMDRYDRSVRDYTCTFTKQELVCGKMTPAQVMEASFRQNPFSVRLKWIENRDKAARVLYVADRWVDKGEQMAVVEPGPIARLFVPYVMRPIHGKDAAKSSRRTIDQFGVRNSLELVLKYCKMAQQENVLDFTYQGTSKVDGRPTLMFERRLPYTGEHTKWPDRILTVHIDRELLLPTLCVAYADDNKKHLLGRYQISNLKLNTNLADSTFTKTGMGLQ